MPKSALEDLMLVDWNDVRMASIHSHIIHLNVEGRGLCEFVFESEAEARKAFEAWLNADRLSNRVARLREMGFQQ